MQYWLTISGKFDALNKRERWMVCCALFVLAYAIINTLLLSPVITRQKSLSNEMEADQAQIKALSLQLKELTHKTVIDPDAQNKEHIATLQSHLQQLETQLSGLQTTLISPDKMPELLRSLLKKNGKLKLIELKTLPVQGLLENRIDESDSLNKIAVNETQKTDLQNPDNQNLTIKASQEDTPVFKHGVEITIEGRYLDLLDYVSALEKMPWHVLWSKADLTVKDYPASQIKLTVYTLSLDKTWLSI